MLRWLEESYGSKEPVNLDKLTIEHVLPQTPTAGWRDTIESELAPDESVEDVYDSLVHTLGNLTLTGYNSELSNGEFTTKRVKLASSGVAMNHEIAALDHWGRQEIHDRAIRLADWAIALWPGPTRSAQVTNTTVRWAQLDQALAELPVGAWTSYGDVAALSTAILLQSAQDSPTPPFRTHTEFFKTEEHSPQPFTGWIRPANSTPWRFSAKRASSSTSTTEPIRISE